MGDKTVGKGAKLEDSNLAAYGSKEHKDAKLGAAKTEKAWEGAGEKLGIQIWRVEKFKIVHWPKESYGSFYDGDAYIVLNTYSDPENKEKKLYNVHFWLGSESSQDEQGVAAYKTVELDDLLGDLPVQFREVQGEESDEFVKLFKSGIKIMKGGIESGFTKVKPEEYKPRLMWVKGKKNIRVLQVDFKVENLNVGDSFVVDAGLTVYAWNGPKAGMFEKRKVGELVQGIVGERNGKAKKVVIDGFDDEKAFWKLFGLDAAPTADQIGKATSDDIKKVKKTVLVHVSDETGHLKREQVADKGLKRDMLKTEDVFIVDLGDKIWVWIGKATSKREKSQAITTAVTYAKEVGYDPKHMSIARVSEGREPKSFFSAFA